MDSIYKELEIASAGWEIDMSFSFYLNVVDTGASFREQAEDPPEIGVGEYIDEVEALRARMGSALCIYLSRLKEEGSSVQAMGNYGD
jgi:hypothetical protein